MDGNGIIWNNMNPADLDNMNYAAQLPENLTDTIPLPDHLRQQLIQFPQTTNENNTITDGAVGGIMSPARNVVFSPPFIDDNTEYKAPPHIPARHDVTPQPTEISSAFGNTMSQNPFYSPGHSLPILPNTMAQQIPQQQFIYNTSLPVLQHFTQHTQQTPEQQLVQNTGSPITQHSTQQSPVYVLQNQTTLSPVQQMQQLQNPQQINTDRGLGAIPRPGNPLYTHPTNHQGFIASTPPLQTQYV